jgi:hypothetical protein
LVATLGEDALEKPYNIVPYYCFWGVILRLWFNIGMVEAASARGRYYRSAGSPRIA